jgi:aspartyl aminopeptidase
VLGRDAGDERGLGACLSSELRSRGVSVEPDQIVGYDLGLFDLQPAATGGLEGEWIFAPRLDNLASCHAAIAALTTAGPCDASIGVVLYDHEECGSRSAKGAASPFLSHVLTRITACIDRGGDAFYRAMAQSFLVSADMAHAVHPNYADRHEPAHMPRLGGGPVIKRNANQSYATDAETEARFRALCRDADVSHQDFVTRSDLGCGSTIGPITAGQLGVRTVDVGSPMLSMHSCREMAASSDVPAMIRVFATLFR